MADGSQVPPHKKKTPSDTIRNATLNEYVTAHSKPNGGIRSFIHSNLFAALLIWALSQAIFFGGFIITYFLKTSQLTEWKGKTDATLTRMDRDGTTHSQYTDQEQAKQISRLETRMDKQEDVTRHVEVLESEHRRLTKDVDDLRNGKK